ncbi:hypothetical protein AVEN_268207-1 [Araneus ventricosus]|uniref:HTH psq-type domain-containing protein n=1 Tax=Araneus ventricosus TaxID=182803 RepID=A0A4Y2P855_ARAVE|nr:hypothetical protein AVEN_117955-1 [Araneus ventricosus]GBN46590.1 hypothetical protein AVEN_268207-1 [Araneus ventricosus]
MEKGLKKKSEIAKEFGIPSNTLSTYLKNRDKIWSSENGTGKNRKRMRGPDCPDVDGCVLKWFKQARDKNIPISGPIMRAKDEQFVSDRISQNLCIRKRLSKGNAIHWGCKSHNLHFLMHGRHEGD